MLEILGVPGFRERMKSQSDMASGARMFFGYDMGRWQ